MAQITAAGIAANAGVAEILNREVAELRTNSDRLDLEALGVHENLGTTNGQGTDTTKETIWTDSGEGGMTSYANEDDAIVPGAMTTGSMSTSYGRFGRAYDITDIAREQQGQRGLSLMRIARQLQQARRVQWNVNALTAGAAGTQVHANTGVQATIDDVYSLLFLARALKMVPFGGGKMMLVLHDNQLSHIQNDLRNESAILQNYAPAQNFAGVKFGNAVYEYDNLLITHTDAVQDDATDYFGVLFGLGGLRFKYSAREVVPNENMFTFANLPGFMLEYDRTAAESTTGAYGTAHMGHSIFDEQIAVLQTGI